ncbi:YopX family protein [Carnobacterium divergens]|uniref:YopX family protein n=1 Tax=Carnobacterium divergens TaxID=2748 RepID=UPI0007F4333F|nr:YopX family protein [Carnobacterium divergens]SBO18621.1 uncharacterised phage protein [Carnobacterium divergens]
MREIKFRAWDKITKKMYKVSSIHLEDEYVDLFEKNIYEEEFKRKFSEIVLMQYTGLKDKNGVEIYEGDIVNCTSGCPHEIVFLEEYAGTYIGGMPAWYLSGLNSGYSWTGEEEITGNKFDNPELLEGDI